MATSTDFPGFSPRLRDFLGDLTKHNNKAWFDSQRQTYREVCLEAGKAFVSAMAPLMHEMAPGIRVEPVVNGSIKRINRDIRFSPDKTPYRTALNFVFWQGAGKPKQSIAFHLRLGATEFGLAAGHYKFDPGQLAAYRQAATAAKSGPALRRIVDDLAEAGFDIHGRHYKKLPQGFDSDHTNADLLLHNGLMAGRGETPPEALFGPQCAAYCAQRLRQLQPLQSWLVAVTR